MALNTILKGLIKVNGELTRVEFHPKTSAERVWISGEGSSAVYLNNKLTDIDSSISTNTEGISTNTTSIGTLNTSVSSLSSRMTTAEGSITSLQSGLEGKADEGHIHIGETIYVWSSEHGDTLNIWASSIENELSDLAGGLQYKGVFATDATLQALLEATTSKAGSYFVYNGSSAYTIPTSLGSKTITIVYGDDGSSTERVIEKNDYVVLNEKLTGEYKISIINNTHGSATTSKVGLVKLATGASTGNEVITAGVLTSKLSGYAKTDALNNFLALNNFNNGIAVHKTLTNIQGSDDYMKFSIQDQAFAKIQIESGNPDLRQWSNFKLQGLAPNSPSDTANIIHQYNIKNYMGMNYFKTSQEEANFTQENVIYAVADES